MLRPMPFAQIFLRLTCLSAGIAVAAAQSQPPAADQFQNCVPCHGGDAQGGEHGPPIAASLLTLDDDELAQIVRGGKPQIGMPAFSLSDADMRGLIRYLRTLERPESQPRIRASVQTVRGESLQGLVLSQSAGEMQLLTDDHRLHLLRKEGERYRAVTSDVDWSGYNGDPSGNRYSKLSQIDATNVSRLAPRWIFQLPGGTNLQLTPVVVAGVMYVTSANECWALDAGSGRSIWHYQRRRTRGIGGTAAGGVNRGVAVAGDSVFMVTDNAHLIALDRSAGTLLWDTEMADWKQNYYGTTAPLIAGGLVLAGVAGGDDGVRGFVAAFDAASGKEAWRFWTVPKPGEPGSETWNGKDINHPGGATWLTGTYDPALGTVYWPTGNAGNDLNGDYRAGDNLYTDSDVALDAKTGKLKWYFQYTPHDVWDWDAVQTPVLVDADWNGQPRKLLLHANRNGFLYVLDRTSGKLLLAKPLVKKLTLGERDRLQRPAGAASGSGAHCRRREDLPADRRRHELVLQRVQPGDGALLRTDAREVRHLHEEQSGMESRRGLHGRNDAKYSRRQFAEGSARIRYPYGGGCLGIAAVRRRRVVGRSSGHRRGPGLLLR